MRYLILKKNEIDCECQAEGTIDLDDSLSCELTDEEVKMIQKYQYSLGSYSESYVLLPISEINAERNKEEYLKKVYRWYEKERKRRELAERTEADYKRIREEQRLKNIQTWIKQKEKLTKELEEVIQQGKILDNPDLVSKLAKVTKKLQKHEATKIA